MQDIEKLSRRIEKTMKARANRLLAARKRADAEEFALRSALVSFIRINGSGSQTRMADSLGVGRAFICELVSGRKGIGNETARKIAEGK